MKKLITICLLILFSAAVMGQGLLKPVSSDIFKTVYKYGKYTQEEPKKSVIVPRLAVGVQGLSYSFKKGAEPIILDAICFGIEWLRYKNANGVPFNDFGVAALLLVSTRAQGYGLGAYGTYNINNSKSLFNLGAHYDFTLKEVLLDTGITWHF